MRGRDAIRHGVRPQIPEGGGDLTSPGAGGGDGDKVRNLLEPPLVTEEAVKQGLLWLVRH